MESRIIRHAEISDLEIRQLLRRGEIRMGGNRHLKIYGILDCRSGRRMKRTNRVFFVSETTAIIAGYRPCGHCMRTAYKKWKDGFIQ